MTAPRRVRVTAPGKLVLFGEYAVLRGAPAIVTAVDRRVRLIPSAVDSHRSPTSLDRSTGTHHDRPEVVACLRESAARWGAAPPEFEIDATALHLPDGQKLGLGSSAAATVAVAAYCEWCTVDRITFDSVLEAALCAHRAVAPRGSGIDVVASTFGGSRVVERRGGHLDSVALTEPIPVSLRVVWAGQPARTSALVARVDAWATAHPADAEGVFDQLAGTVRSAVRAWERGSGASMIQAAKEYGEGMRALGTWAGVDIVTATLREIAAMAEAHGGSAKPSGAGGGDVAVAFLPDRDAARAFDVACAARGHSVIAMATGAAGVRLEEGDEVAR